MCGECGKSLSVENDPFFDSIEGNLTTNSEEVRIRNTLSWQIK